MNNLSGRYPQTFGKAPSPGERYFQYRTAESGNAVQVEIRFANAGVNYGTRKNEGKGVYVHITPVEVKDGMVSMMLMGDYKTSGFKVFVLPMERRNAKKVETVAEMFDAIVPEIAQLFTEGKYQDAVDKIRAICPDPRAVPVPA